MATTVSKLGRSWWRQVLEGRQWQHELWGVAATEGGRGYGREEALVDSSPML